MSGKKKVKRSLVMKAIQAQIEFHQNQLDNRQSLALFESQVDWRLGAIAACKHILEILGRRSKKEPKEPPKERKPNGTIASVCKFLEDLKDLASSMRDTLTDIHSAQPTVLECRTVLDEGHLRLRIDVTPIADEGVPTRKQYTISLPIERNSGGN